MISIGGAVYLACCGDGSVLNRAIPNPALVAESACAGKLAREWWQTLVRAIFCGIFMYMAVSIYRDKKTTLLCARVHSGGL